MELQIGQINSLKDTIHLLKILLTKISPGILKMKPKNGKSQLLGSKNDNKSYTVGFGAWGRIKEKEKDDDVQIATDFSLLCNWYLIGDLKFLFMMMGG